MRLKTDLFCLGLIGCLNGKPMERDMSHEVEGLGFRV